MRRVAAGVYGAVLALFFYGCWIYWAEKDEPSFPQSRQQIYTGNGYMIKTSGEVDPGQDGMTMIFEEESDLAAAKRYLPELLVPTYIPEGYEFEKLEISTFMSGRWEYSYIYNDGVDALEITQEKGGEVVAVWSGSDVEKASILTSMD